MNTEGQYTCKTCGEELNIVGIIQDDCERTLRAEDLTEGEKSILLYLESCMVDHDGEIDWEKMNHRDRQGMKIFEAAGILEISNEMDSQGFSKIEKFTDTAWDLAAECRKQRGN